MATTTTTPITAEQLYDMGPDERSELVRGALVPMAPANRNHGRALTLIATVLAAYVEENGLGEVYTGDTGFILQRSPDTVRAPDCSFVRQARIPDNVADERGFIPGYPDLAVEVLSPDDRPGEIRAKVADYFAAGALQIWIVDPIGRTITVHAPASPAITLSETGTLDGGELLPGFKMPVHSLLPKRHLRS